MFDFNSGEVYKKVPGLTLEDAITAIQESSLSLSTTPAGDQNTGQSLLVRVKEIFEKIKTKVMAFVNGLLKKLRLNSAGKLDFIKKNEARIKNYSKPHMISMPKNLANPLKPYSAKLIWARIVDAGQRMGVIGTLARDEETIRKMHAKYTDEIIMNVLAGMVTDPDAKLLTDEIIYAEYVGKDASIDISKLNKEALIQQAVQLHADFEEFAKQRGEYSKFLDTITRDNKLFEAENRVATNMLVTLVSRFVTATLRFTSVMSSVLMKRFNVIYSILHRMATH